MGGSLLMAFDLGGGSGRCMLVDPETAAAQVNLRNRKYPAAPNTAAHDHRVSMPDHRGEAVRPVHPALFPSLASLGAMTMRQ